MKRSAKKTEIWKGDGRVDTEFVDAGLALANPDADGGCWRLDSCRLQLERDVARSICLPSLPSLGGCQ